MNDVLVSGYFGNWDWLVEFSRNWVLEFSRLISWQYFTVALNHVPCPRWMREIKREGNGRWLWIEMTLILMRKIIGISLRLFLNCDVDICLLF